MCETFVIYSCMQERVDEPFDVQKEQLVKDAMKKYYGTKKEEGLIELRSSTEADGILIKPLWETATIQEDNEHRVVDVMILSEKFFTFSTPESAEKSKQQKDQRLRISKTSLVYVVEKATGREEMFLMTIVPDHSFIQSTNFKPFDEMSYKRREKTFKGYIFYHDLEGRFVNGWRYIGGKIHGTMQPLTEKPDFDLVKTRSGEECYNVYLIIFWESCVDWYTNGEFTHSNCTNWSEQYWWYSYCENLGFGNGGGGYQGGSNQSGPPTNPCTAGSGGNSLNNSMLSHPTIQSDVDLVLKGKMTSNKEWAVSIGLNSDGSYSVSSPQEGTSAVSGTIPAAPAGSLLYSYGHSHPSDGVPSPGDLYVFLEKVQQNASLQTMYVYGTGWNNATEIYAINVSDRSAVSSFLSQFPKNNYWNSVTYEFKGQIKIDFENVLINYNSGQCNTNNPSYPYMQHAVALSYVMSKYNMGVTLSRKVNNEMFKIIKAMDIQNSSGQEILEISTCF